MAQLEARPRPNPPNVAVSAPATLDYGLAAPRRRRWVTRLGIALAVLIAVAWAGTRYGPPLVRHAQILWWQRTCMAYARPADRVVFADDPIKAATLARRAPRRYIQMHSAGPALEREPPAYQGLAANLGYFTGGGTPLYLHERTNADGERRLVVVYCNRFGSRATVWTWTMVPATLTRPARWVGPPTRRPEFADVPKDTLRVFAGQDDPNDAASFTIAFDGFDGRAGVLRGKLVGDAVELTREPPSTQPASSAPTAP